MIKMPARDLVKVLTGNKAMLKIIEAASRRDNKAQTKVRKDGRGNER